MTRRRALLRSRGWPFAVVKTWSLGRVSSRASLYWSNSLPRTGRSLMSRAPASGFASRAVELVHGLQNGLCVRSQRLEEGDYHGVVPVRACVEDRHAELVQSL